jgi:hypothetical protein
MVRVRRGARPVNTHNTYLFFENRDPLHGITCPHNITYITTIDKYEN